MNQTRAHHRLRRCTGVLAGSRLGFLGCLGFLGVSNPRPTHDEKPGTLLRARYLHR
jgi:hypothetical protein